MLPMIANAPKVEPQTYVIVGAQWGDEGKGKLVDLFSDEAHIDVRSQGGNNAGHTVVRDGKTYKLHLIPSGVLSKNCESYITGGVVLDPPEFLKEVSGLEEHGIQVINRLWISSYTNITLSYHRLLDRLQEQAKGKNAIGTTGRGIGPTYSDKTNRMSITAGEFINPEKFRTRLERNIDVINKLLASIYQHPPLNAEEVFASYQESANKLKPFVKNNLEVSLNKAIREGKVVLFEGAQGPWLDNTFGTLPYVTSSQTLAAGVVAGAAVGPSNIKATLAVAKAYTTRVGSGPMPTEWNELEYAGFNHHEAGEVGTSTGRLRRVGWFDAPIVKTAALYSGAQTIALTKLDILDTYKKIKVCVAYLFEGMRYDHVPGPEVDLSNVTPIYEEMDGWEKPTSNCKHYDELPEKAKEYVMRIQELCETKISIVSVGPDRKQTIYVK